MIDIATRPEHASFQPEVFESKHGELLAVRFDVNELLEHEVGPDWQERICQAVTGQGTVVVRNGMHPTTREADPMSQFALLTLEGRKMADVAPGLWELYRGPFKHMTEASLLPGHEPFTVYDDPIDALETTSQQVATASNAQYKHRYEAHVDQRNTDVLAVALPDSDDEGGLRIGSNPDAQTVEEIDEDYTRIVHKAGTLLVFSQGRLFPHYTEEITTPGSRRVTISLNYPLMSETPEELLSIRENALGPQQT